MLHLHFNLRTFVLNIVTNFKIYFENASSDLLLEFVPEEVLLSPFPRKIGLSFILDYALLIIVDCFKHWEVDNSHVISDFFIAHHGLATAVWLSWTPLICSFLKVPAQSSQMNKFGCFLFPVLGLTLITACTTLAFAALVDWIKPADDQQIEIRLLYLGFTLLVVVTSVLIMMAIPLLIITSQRFRKWVKLRFHYWATISIFLFVGNGYSRAEIFKFEAIKYFASNSFGILTLSFLCVAKYLLPKL